MITTDILLALHFLGLMMGAGGGFGSGIVMRAAAKLPPEQAAPLRALGPTLVRFSSIGLVLMVLTGITMVWLKYVTAAALPAMFWVKMLFVATLAIAALVMEISYAQMKRGDMKAAARLPLLGPVAGISSLLAMLFAVLAFH